MKIKMNEGKESDEKATIYALVDKYRDEFVENLEKYILTFGLEDEYGDNIGSGLVKKLCKDFRNGKSVYELDDEYCEEFSFSDIIAEYARYDEGKEILERADADGLFTDDYADCIYEFIWSTK